MKKTIQSFEVDHNRLQRGLYVSRKDAVGSETVTTFDIRVKVPNRPPFLGTAGSHTIEHLGAVFLRNHPDWGSRIVYFGPMGCRTGFYLLAAGDLSSEEIAPLITAMFIHIRDYSGTIPGTTSVECGNYQDHDLEDARAESKTYLEEVLLQLTKETTEYPR
ncbi:MAG: S-ribosylhomocysteine lyase [Spirochaetales bacterium]|nr:S-ribosylhomocysteine lyase [Spirochaetales bacterium]